ncbi:MAG TPA: DegT/DnrJ/EryC1/StrS aminotransferase family protein [Candidatus Acidoferrales bacterium]|nr:DegT/DnrJ/EryC1/StrS aminotransferase family protein [Candidatus Acidoferrales bacterium]
MSWTLQGVHEVPFHRAAVGEEEIAAISEVIRSGWLTMGPKTIEFEERFASYVGARHAIAVSSGTAALHLALDAAGIGAAHEVLIPATTFTATGEVVKYLGARPVLVDIDPDTMNLDVLDAAGKVTPRTRAIVPVHLGGLPCDMDEVHSLARTHHLHVVEDAAHALPSEYHGVRVGSLSEMTAFSFYATKTLTTGEGGMITTESDHCAKRVRLMRLHGIAGDAWKRYAHNGSWYYEVVEAGYKYNLTDLQAALGLVQLSKCDTMRESRRRVAERYNAAFGCIPALQPPSIASDRDSSWHLYVLRLNLDRLKIDRNAFVNELRSRGIGTSVHFIPLNLHPFYQKTYGYRPGDCPVAEAEFSRCISLPIYPGIDDSAIDQVVEAVTEVCRETRR